MNAALLYNLQKPSHYSLLHTFISNVKILMQVHCNMQQKIKIIYIYIPLGLGFSTVKFHIYNLYVQYKAIVQRCNRRFQFSGKWLCILGKFLRNVWNHAPSNKASYPRKPE